MGIKRSTGHTQTPTETNTPNTDAHTRKNNTPNPQTNSSHKHLTMLEGMGVKTWREQVAQAWQQDTVCRNRMNTAEGCHGLGER